MKTTRGQSNCVELLNQNVEVVHWGLLGTGHMLAGVPEVNPHTFIVDREVGDICRRKGQVNEMEPLIH